MQDRTGEIAKNNLSSCWETGFAVWVSTQIANLGGLAHTDPLSSRQKPAYREGVTGCRCQNNRGKKDVRAAYGTRTRAMSVTSSDTTPIRTRPLPVCSQDAPGCHAIDDIRRILLCCNGFLRIPSGAYRKCFNCMTSFSSSEPASFSSSWPNNRLGGRWAVPAAAVLCTQRL